MKTLFTIILLFTASFCFGQTSVNPYKKIADQNKKTDSIHASYSFDAFSQSKVEYHENLMKQYTQQQKFVFKQDSAYWQFVKEFLEANKADLSRISPLGDSLKVTTKGIELILKPKKK